MNFKKIGRFLVCLLLICCLLVNISPIRARAVVSESVLIGAGIVVGSILVGLGLGLSQDSTQNVLTDLVHDCVSVIQSDYDFIDEEGLIEVYTKYSGATAQYYASRELVEAVRSWMFKSEVVTEVTMPTWGTGPFKVSINGTSYSYSAWGDSVCVPVVVRCYTDNTMWNHFGVVSTGPYACVPSYWESSDMYDLGEYHWVCEKTVIDRNLENATSSPTTFTGFIEVLYEYTTYSKSKVSDMILSAVGAASGSPDSPIDSSSILVQEGLTSGYIASSGLSLSEGYASWYGNSITIPGETDSDDVIVGYPLGLGPTLDDTLALTQKDVWDGVSTFDGSDTDLENPDDNDDDGGNLTLGDVTVTTFLAKLLADLTRGLFGSSGPQTLTELFGSTWIEMRSEIATLSGWLSQILDAIKAIPSEFEQWFTDLVDVIQAIPEGFTDWMTEIITSIQTIAQTIVDGLVDALESLCEMIIEGIQSLFQPAEGFIDDKIDNLIEKYPFAESIAATGSDLKSFLLNLGSVPPVIYIDLDAATGSYDWGEKMVLIDFSFYEPYKASMDAVLSAFLWLWFCWRMVHTLPNLISGTAGVVGPLINSYAYESKREDDNL